jgi:hypothetical protein
MTFDPILWFQTSDHLNDDLMGTTSTIPYQDLLFNYTPVIPLKDNVWTTFANVATVRANTGTNVINILSLTGSYNLINGGVYSNTAYPLKDIVRAGDNVLIRSDSNTSNSQLVTTVDYANNLVYVANNYTSSVYGANSYISVNRTYISNTAAFARIIGPLGLVYTPYFVTEDNNPGGSQSIITQSGDYILIG